MITLGFSYFIFLYIDIRLHMKKAKKALKEKEAQMRIVEEQWARTEVLR